MPFFIKVIVISMSLHGKIIQDCGTSDVVNHLLSWKETRARRNRSVEQAVVSRIERFDARSINTQATGSFRS